MRQLIFKTSRRLAAERARSMVACAVVASVLVACVSKPIAPAAEPKDPLFSQAERELLDGENDLAYTDFATFSATHPTSSYSLAAQFNMAVAKEGLGEWQDAIDRYRAVSRASVRTAPRLQALALYRLSYCFEALGEDTALVATLKDAQARGSNLPAEVTSAEIPARLGAAYARLGQMDEALKQFDSAEKGLRRLRALNGTKVPAWLPQALYDMGRLSHRRPTLESFEMDLQPLEKTQAYLLEAAELEQPPWSKRAADDLRASYTEFDAVLESRPAIMGTDPTLEQRERQERQWDGAQLLLESMRQLRAYRLESESPTVQGIFTFVKSLEKKLHQVLAEPKIGDENQKKDPPKTPTPVVGE